MNNLANKKGQPQSFALPVNSSAYDRVAFTPKEFAAKFGRSQTWTYRLLYAGKIDSISPSGCLLIPGSEVGRLLSEAAKYTGSSSLKLRKNHRHVEQAPENSTGTTL